MNHKHFEFTEEVIDFERRVLHRIRATRDILEHGIEKGDIGGFVESYDNLSDTAWVYGNAKVFGPAKVFENALVTGDALVFGRAQVFGNAKVSENARVFGSAVVFDNAKVSGDAVVFGNTEVSGNAEVSEDSEVFGYARVCECAEVYGNAHISGDAEVKSTEDYIVFKNFWSSGRYFTWTRSNNMWKVGCFYGTGGALIKKAYKDSDMSGKMYECIVKAVNEMNKLLKEGQ